MYKEKADLKTTDSRRAIEIRASMQKALDDQRVLTESFDSPYVFINTQGRPILQSHCGASASTQ